MSESDDDAPLIVRSKARKLSTLVVLWMDETAAKRVFAVSTFLWDLQLGLSCSIAQLNSFPFALHLWNPRC